MRRQSGLITRRGGVAGLVNEYTGHNMIFPGHISYTAAAAAPSGWLAANGAAISRTVYASLFAAVGTTYGAGDGSTTFNLPDLRGEFLRGVDSGRGVDTGRTQGSGQLDAMQGHKHNVAVNSGAGASQVSNYSANTFANNVASTTPITDGTNGTPRTAAETRPRNVAQLAIIKY